VDAAETPTALVEAVRNAASTQDDGPMRILVTGSIYLIGEVFESLGISPADLNTRRNN
jgi:folylpolyglutamate synthase/dihydropteroate synthase